jgi:ligand-binding sensor domain-containing protein
MKQIVQKGIFIFLLFMKINGALSQQFYAKPITINTGLPSNSIYSILEDNQRYIWFTSDEGLIRYDGIHFQIFKSDLQSSFSGSGIMQDKWGRIWYQNFDGISYYVENNKLNELKKEGKTSYLPQQFTDKYLFTLGEKAIIIYDLKSLKRIKKIAIDQKMEIFTSLIFKEEFYFVMNNELFKINKNLKLKKCLNLPLNILDFPILFSSDKKLFFLKKNAQESSIWEIKNGALVLKTNLPKNTIIQNCKLIDSTFYIETTNGIYTYSSTSGKYLNQYFKGKSISDVIIDSKNNYWFSSPLDGLLIVPNLDIIQYNFTDFSALRIIPYEKDILISTKKGEVRAFNEKNQTNKIIYNSTLNSEIYYTYLNTKKNEFHYVSSDGLTYFNTLNKKNSCTKINYAIKQILQAFTYIKKI